MEYDLIVAPTANPARIRLAVSGSRKLYLDQNGDLVAETNTGRFVQHKPAVYQKRNGQKVAIGCRYKLNRNTVALDLDAYDTSADLTVDPVISYITYIGGTQTDTAARMTTDAAGNVYLAGDTSSTAFPVSAGAFRSASGGNIDSYVMKFSPSGALMYSTYIGGNGTPQHLV